MVINQETKGKTMDEKMFCFQCQETCKNSGCTIRGMCGKQPETANRMDELISQLKVLALTKKPNRELGLFAIQSLFEWKKQGDVLTARRLVLIAIVLLAVGDFLLFLCHQTSCG
jgi:hydroxylamine reductase (hybrid-cluster protein)